MQIKNKILKITINIPISRNRNESIVSKLIII
jgi:hypothetical protein